MPDATLSSRPVDPPDRTGAGGGTRAAGALLITVLALLSFVEPLGTDVYLPAFPRMVGELGTSPAVVQLTLTTFMVGLAGGHLLFGPLSDHYGRRTPLLVGTVVAALAGAACAVAPSVTWLAVLRAVHGLAAASGMVIARSVVSDVASGAQAARLFGVLMALLGIAPITAPLIGGAVLGVGGWRLVFWGLAGLTALLAIAVAVWVPETLDPERRTGRGHGSPGFVTSARGVLANRVFLAYALAFSCAFGALFCYVSGSSFLYQDILGLGVGGSAVAVAVTVLVHSATALLGGRLTRLVSPARLVVAGLGAMLVTALALGGLALGEVLTLPSVLALLVPFFVGTGLVMPSATSVAFDALPHSAGTGSAVLGSLQNAVAALTAPVVGLAGNAVEVALAAGMTAATLLGLAALALARGAPTRSGAGDDVGDGRAGGPAAPPGGGALRGVVQSDHGEPIRHATVTLMRRDGRQVDRTVADADGRFEVASTHGGAHLVLGRGGGHPPVVEHVALMAGLALDHDLNAPPRATGAPGAVPATASGAVDPAEE